MTVTPTDLDRPDPADVVIGVDTHKDVHVAVALDRIGRRLGEFTVDTNPAGIAGLLAWSGRLGSTRLWGVEGTGSYGAGLTRALRDSGEQVHEVTRPDRRVRRSRGKSDTIDAEVAARAVLADHAIGVPKTATGPAEALRQLRATRRSAVKA